MTGDVRCDVMQRLFHRYSMPAYDDGLYYGHNNSYLGHGRTQSVTQQQMIRSVLGAGTGRGAAVVAVKYAELHGICYSRYCRYLK